MLNSCEKLSWSREKNSLGATKEAMQEVISNLKNKPDLCFVDGEEKILVERIETLSIVKGECSLH